MDFTFAELLYMYNGKRKHDYEVQSLAICVLANVNRDPKKKPKPFEPDDFNPLLEKKSEGKGLIARMKQAWGKE